MSFTSLADGIQVFGQITKDDIRTAADAGVSVIINNRPDGEEPGQPTNSELASAAAECHIAWIHIPVIPGQMSMVEVEGMIRAIGEADGVALAFCRTGTRSTNLWGLAMAASKQLPPGEIMQKAAAAGYDLSGISPILTQLYEA